MRNRAADETIEHGDVKSLLRRRCLTSLVVLQLSLILCGCGAKVVYKDNFQSAPIGVPPGPPQIGTSIVSGDVIVAENPINDVSPDHWLQLKRVSTEGPLAIYTATFSEAITEGGTVALVGYIPGFNPGPLSVYFEPPAFAPAITFLHIDLLPNGDIRVNDATIEGTYKFDKSIAFLVGFDLVASPATATLLVRGGAEDASATVEIPAAAVGFGLARVRIETPFLLGNDTSGRFFINDVIATQ